MTLAEIRKNETVIVRKIKDDTVRQRAIRLGLYEGAELVCIARISDGPIVLRGEYGELALGRKLSEKIDVKVLRASAQTDASLRERVSKL